MVHIQMTIISWMLELLASIICLIYYFVYDGGVGRFFGILDVVLNFIIIPTSYNLNNDVNKVIIEAEGWFSGMLQVLNINKGAEGEVENGEHERHYNNNPIIRDRRDPCNEPSNEPIEELQCNEDAISKEVPTVSRKIELKTNPSFTKNKNEKRRRQDHITGSHSGPNLVLSDSHANISLARSAKYKSISEKSRFSNNEENIDSIHLEEVISVHSLRDESVKNAWI